MHTYPVSALKVDTYFDAPLYLDKDYILLSPDTPVTRDLINRLILWNYKEVCSEGEAVSKPAAAAAVEDSALRTATLHEDLQTEEQLHEASGLYLNLISYADQAFKHFSSNTVLDFPSVSEKAKDAIDMIKKDKDLILSFHLFQQPVENYLITHAVNTMILSLATGLFLKLPAHRLIELGVAAFLHDIGMLKIPSKLYLNANPLSPQAKKTITAHTLLGYRILKSLSANENIALGVAEHQERVDGSGYHKRLRGDAISLYARIIGVTCSYDAIVSDRPYKKSHNGHVAMLDLLKTNRKAYDERVLKAFVYCLALYPLGTHVLLGNGAKGLVCKTNPENPKYPIVRILQDQNGTNLEEQMLIKTSPDDGLAISRALKVDEIKGL